MEYYLDNAATTQVLPVVIDAMIPYMETMWKNPSSLYSPSVKIKNDIENCRRNIACYINAEPDEVYFTSCGSESNCTVIQGFIKQCMFCDKKPVIITTPIEHKSILSCLKDCNGCCKIIYLDVDTYGKVDIDKLNFLLGLYSKEDYSVLVSIQFANNEIGTIQDIKAISKVVHQYDNAIFHTDAVQAFGHEKINVKKLGIDMMSASGHKIGMCKGIGLLYKKNGINIKPIIYGSQENGLRGGTENIPYIIGLSKAVDIAIHKDEHEKYIKSMRDYFIEKLLNIGKINGSLDNRLSNNINVTFNDNVSGESLIYLLDMSDIYVSAGSACNSHDVVGSHVLNAIGLNKNEIDKTIRITLSYDITKEDIDYVYSEIVKSINLIREGDDNGN